MKSNTALVIGIAIGVITGIAIGVGSEIGQYIVWTVLMR